MLKKYKSLSSQAEKINTYDSYKELYDTICGMTYEEQFQLMYDAETLLDIILVNGLRYDCQGLLYSMKEIKKKIDLILAIYELRTTKIRFTHESLEGKEGRKAVKRDELFVEGY